MWNAKYFTYEEMIHSDTAKAKGIKNIPDPTQFENLSNLVVKLLDPLRERFGKPITVNSGFRNKEVNAKIGGAVDSKGNPKSQHCKGEAADITSSDNKRLFELIKNEFEYDQLINEQNLSWIHVSLKKTGKNRKQVLKL